VNNAAKHGAAKKIHLLFTTSSRDIIIDIQDDGRGMAQIETEKEDAEKEDAQKEDAEKKDAEKKGIGLVIMQHRADLIGARLEILENTTGGTIIRCRIEKKYLS